MAVYVLRKTLIVGGIQNMKPTVLGRFDTPLEAREAMQRLADKWEELWQTNTQVTFGNGRNGMRYAQLVIDDVHVATLDIVRRSH